MKSLSPWCIPTFPPILRTDDVHIWQAQFPSIRQLIPQFVPVLSSNERCRANRYHFLADQTRFIAGRGLLRALLAIYLQLQPEHVSLHHDNHGKPCLKDPTQNIQFNVAHSNERILYAFAPDRRVGVDIEHHRHIPNAIQIATRYFTPHERHHLETTPSSQRDTVFLSYWTRKEAYSKAIGSGLGLPMNRFDVSRNLHAVTQLHDATSTRNKATNWTLQSIPLSSRYYATFVVEGTSCTPHYFLVNTSQIMRHALSPETWTGSR